MKCHAVLLDTVSIQTYIFQSNKLKENLGASFLVDEIYKKYLEQTVSDILAEKFDLNAWKTQPDIIRLENSNTPFEIGYIGGGNALLLFREKKNATDFIKQWTTSLLINTPGIITSVASDEFDLDNFSDSYAKLSKLLQDNKSKYVPETTLPRHGITSECTLSCLSMDVWNYIANKYVSANSNSKLEASKTSQEYVRNNYVKILKDKFLFTDDLEQLGGKSGEDSHIAIVHIDGNSMSERFKQMRTLRDIRKLSASVAEAVQNAFSDLLQHIVDNFDNIMTSLGFDINDKAYNKILPIRPIVLGGDDITFVCDAKLGVYFSNIFIKSFESQTVHDNKKLTACAGVSIIKTKYPFYRGYKIAEQLCKNAKKKRRENNDSYSYIDFHISTGGIAGTLDAMRDKYFKVNQGDLIYRPYKIVPNETHDDFSLDLFIKNTGLLKKDFPNNKIHELLQVLSLSEGASIQFVKEMAYRKRILPKIKGHLYEKSLFEKGITPYLDMIELMEFYPKFVWQNNDNDNDNNDNDNDIGDK